MVLKGGVLENKRRRKRRDIVFFFSFFWRIIRRTISTCNKKPQTLFLYNIDFKHCFGIFFNKTWDYVITWIDVFNNIEKHKLLQ
jgi:hypothetical protein